MLNHLMDGRELATNDVKRKESHMIEITRENEFLNNSKRVITSLRDKDNSLIKERLEMVGGRWKEDSNKLFDTCGPLNTANIPLLLLGSTSHICLKYEGKTI